MTNRVPLESIELLGKGMGANSGGYSSGDIGLNPRVLSTVETNLKACSSSRLPCTKAIPFPEDQTDETQDTRSLSFASWVAANNSRLSYSNAGGFSRSEVQEEQCAYGCCSSASNNKFKRQNLTTIIIEHQKCATKESQRDIPSCICGYNTQQLERTCFTSNP